MAGQKTTTALVFILENRGKIFDALNYSDDVGGVDRGVRAWVAFYAFQALLRELGLVEATKKAHPPSTFMPYLGIQYCSITMTKSVTPERLNELEMCLDFTLEKKKVTKAELESLVHKLL